MFVCGRDGERLDELNQSSVTLYHGSLGGIHFPIKVDFSKKPCDFGQGFYLGDMKKQAENRVCTSSNGVIYEMRLDLTDLKVFDFKDDVLWALYVGINRGKIDLMMYPKLLKFKQQLDAHDVLIGLIADDKIAQSYNRFMEGLVTDKVLIECLKSVKYGKQYVIKSQKACAALELMDSYKLTKEQRDNSLVWGRTQKEQMGRIMTSASKAYRREGKFIDELLEGFR